MAGRVVAAKPKSKVRRKALQDMGYDPGKLSNIDFVDAALCALQRVTSVGTDINALAITKKDSSLCQLDAGISSKPYLAIKDL
jgi:hypothetical protein